MTGWEASAVALSVYLATGGASNHHCAELVLFLQRICSISDIIWPFINQRRHYLKVMLLSPLPLCFSINQHVSWGSHVWFWVKCERVHWNYHEIWFWLYHLTFPLVPSSGWMFHVFIGFWANPCNSTVYCSVSSGGKFLSTFTEVLYFHLIFTWVFSIFCRCTFYWITFIF